MHLIFLFHQVMESSGTWIDWQYLIDAANLLAKCRYTLKYTYPYAYYMESGPRKELVGILNRNFSKLCLESEPFIYHCFFQFSSLSTNKLNWKRRLKTCRGKLSERKRQTVGICKIKWILRKRGGASY